jgi:exodeoxyribonuclease VII small subunit
LRWNLKEKKETFEELLKKVENIVEQMENGTLNLENSLALYEEGIKSITKLNEILSSAREKVMKLVPDKNGTNVIDPFDEEEIQ